VTEVVDRVKGINGMIRKADFVSLAKPVAAKKSK
jgi:hypothetical protein